MQHKVEKLLEDALTACHKLQKFSHGKELEDI